jgi:hypothetical protein
VVDDLLYLLVELCVWVSDTFPILTEPLAYLLRALVHRAMITHEG